MDTTTIEKVYLNHKEINLILTALSLYEDSIPTRKKQIVSDYNLAHINQEQLTGNLSFLDSIREQIEELKDAIIEQTN